MKKYLKTSNKKRVIVIGFIYFIIGSVCLFLDYKLKFNTNILSELVKTLFDLIIVVLGVWVTCYLLFLQVYKDSYPLKIINQRYLSKMKEILIYSLYVVVFGVINIARGHGLIENIYFSLSGIVIIMCILVPTYKSNKMLMINTYIDDFCRDIKNKLDSSEARIDKGVLENIKHFLDDSIIREEYFIVQNVTKGLGGIFQGFLDNSIEIIRKEGTNEEVEKSFKNILDVYLFELERCSKINSDLVVEDIIKLNVKNLVFLIESKQTEWFKEYLSEVNFLYFKIQRDEKEYDTKSFSFNL